MKSKTGKQEIQLIRSRQDRLLLYGMLHYNNRTPTFTDKIRLHEPAYQVMFVVENTGKVYGGDVNFPFFNTSSNKQIWSIPQIPQLYVNFPPSAGEPPSVLKGFTNVEMNPSQEVPVTITLSRHDLSIWDISDQGWRKPNGTIRLRIGASSRDIRLHGVIPWRCKRRSVLDCRYHLSNTHIAFRNFTLYNIHIYIFPKLC
jgi:hypothetical protein